MNFRKLDVTEHGKTRALWEEVFPEDTKAFLDYYYEVKTRDNEIYVAENDNGEICSMLQLNPYQMQMGQASFMSHYIIAVATKLDYRKKGLMRELLKRAMQDMYRQKEIFTFLMPAAEAIYLPFDFRYIYNQAQGRIKGKQSKKTTGRIVEATEKNCQEMVLFGQEHLKPYQIYTKRDYNYYSVLIKEQISENGGMMLIYHKDELVGMFAYAKGEEVEIREPLVKVGYEADFLHAIYQLTGDEEIEVKCIGLNESVKGNEMHPCIMARVLHPELLLEALKAKRDLNFTINLEDPIILENHKCFHITAKAGEYIKVAPVGEWDDVDHIPVAALTSFLFGYKNLEEISAEYKMTFKKETVQNLENIGVFSQIFLNEVV
ncbi:GNAT family N-acetyltransferase [Lachnospiraceae bacterium OttesenSCG-928-E19]|nr:GNAT family N-acetyltransferase [Lachnospiraceae bacterium OttesenSCG-928-E19]